MVLFSIIVASIGIGCSAALFLYWSFGLERILTTRRSLPTARAGIPLAQSTPVSESVCVIVPAHNEAHAVATVIRTLRAQDHPNLRIVLALDRCTDGTPEIALNAIDDDPRFEIIQINECPPGWAGKVNAVWNALNASSGAKDADLILFIDADTELDPRCLTATSAMMRESSLDMLSLLSTLTHENWYEAIAQPAATMELLRQYPLLQANRQTDRRPFANGQFMMFRATSYHAFGGHEAVKHELLEDLALAREIAQSSINGVPMRAGVYLADGMMHCRMYESWTAFGKGWRRIYTEAARRRPAKLRRCAARARVPGTILPAGALMAIFGGLATLWTGHTLLGVAAIASGASSLIVFYAAILLAYALGRAPLWGAILYPVGAWLTGNILIQAAKDLEQDRPTEWGGKLYTRVRQ